MRRELIQCEICKTEHDAQYVLPASWVTLVQRDCDDQHLCSGACLLAYAKELMGDTSKEQQSNAPPTKMRRFLLVDENAEITEGIKWSNGTVDIPCGSPHSAWATWDEFKASHDGSGIQWIDQEVSDATAN